MEDGRAFSDANSPLSRTLFCFMFGAGTAVYFVLPIWAGILEEDFGFSAKQIGWLLSADMTAEIVAVLLARLWFPLIHYRFAVLGALAVYVFGNLACLGADSFPELLSLRYVAGFGMGALGALAYVGIGATREPDRNFGLALSLQVTIGGALLFATPHLIRLGGINSYFICFAAMMLMVPFLLRNTPASFQEHTSSQSQDAIGLSIPLVLAFASVVVFFVGANSFWTFVERIAVQKGMEAEFVSLVLAISVIVSVFGSLLAAWMSDRFGRAVPIVVGISVAVVSIGLLLLEPSTVLFFIAINLFNWVYNFVIPFQVGWIAKLDTTGRNIMVVGVVQGVGLALGPILAGSLVSGTNYIPVIYMSTSCLLLSAVMYSILRMVVSGRRQSNGAIQAQSPAN